jgi:hypothetical protein
MVENAGPDKLLQQVLRDAPGATSFTDLPPGTQTAALALYLAKGERVGKVVENLTHLAGGAEPPPAAGRLYQAYTRRFLTDQSHVADLPVKERLPILRTMLKIAASTGRFHNPRPDLVRNLVNGSEPVGPHRAAITPMEMPEDLIEVTRTAVFLAVDPAAEQDGLRAATHLLREHGDVSAGWSAFMDLCEEVAESGQDPRVAFKRPVLGPEATPSSGIKLGHGYVSMGGTRIRTRQ